MWVKKISVLGSISVGLVIVATGLSQAKTVASQSEESRLLLLREAAGEGVFCVTGTKPEVELITDIPEMICARENWGPKTLTKEDYSAVGNGRIELRFEPNQMVVLRCQNQRSVKEERVSFLVLGGQQEIDFCWPGSSRQANWTFFVRDTCDPEVLKRDERVMVYVRRWAPHTYYCPHQCSFDN